MTKPRHFTPASVETVSRARKPKGSVSVDADRGWLRLRCRHRGKSHTMAIRLPDNPLNRALAERQAQLIEADLEADSFTSGAFDPSLAKYRVLSQK